MKVAVFFYVDVVSVSEMNHISFASLAPTSIHSFASSRMETTN
jgi:hypothetical protein